MRKVLHLTAVLSAALAAAIPNIALSQSQTQTAPSGVIQGVPTDGSSIVPPTTTDGGVGTGQAAPAGQTQPRQTAPNRGANTPNTSNNGVLDNRTGGNTSNNGVIDNRTGGNTSNNGVLDNDRNPSRTNSIDNNNGIGAPTNGTIGAPGTPTNTQPGAGQIVPNNGGNTPTIQGDPLPGAVQIAPYPGNVNQGTPIIQPGAIQGTPNNTGTGVNQGTPANGTGQTVPNNTGGTGVNQGTPANGTSVNQGTTTQPGAGQTVPNNTGTGVNQGTPANGTGVNQGTTTQPGAGQTVPGNTGVPGTPTNSQPGTTQTAPTNGTTNNQQSSTPGTTATQSGPTIVAGQPGTGTLDDDLLRATCNQNWQQAITIVNQALTAAPANQTAYRAQLQQYRARLQDLRDSQVRVPNWSNQCQ